MQQEEELVVVFEGPIAKADLARSVLQGHGVTPYMSGESLVWVENYSMHGGPNVVKVAVPESQAEAAREVLEHPVR